MTIYPEVKNWLHFSAQVKQQFPFHIFIAQIKHSYPKHRHDFLEFSLVIDGEGYEMINGKRHPMKRGTCAFLLPDQLHEIHTTSQKPLKLFNCMFDLGFLLQPSMYTTGLKQMMYSQDVVPPFVQLDETQMHTISAIMELLLRECKSNNGWRFDLIQCKIIELLIYFDRFRMQEHPIAIDNKNENRSSIWQIIHYVHSHYSEPLSLASLSSMFMIDASHLSKQFKKEMGLNFTHFLHELRVRHACSLLISTTMTGIEIAQEVGFGSISTYFRIFMELKNMTPSEYRKKYSRNEEALADSDPHNGAISAPHK